MKTARIKVIDLQTLQLEKQRLQMQVEYTEEQIIERVSNFAYELPTHLVSSVLPFGLGNKPGVVKGIRSIRSFIVGFLGGEGSAGKREIIKTVFPLAKAFITGALSGILKKKKA